MRMAYIAPILSLLHLFFIQFSSPVDFNTLPVDCQNFLPLTTGMLCCVCVVAQKQCKQILATIRSEMYEGTDHAQAGTIVQTWQSRFFYALVKRIVIADLYVVSRLHSAEALCFTYRPNACQGRANARLMTGDTSHEWLQCAPYCVNTKGLTTRKYN